MQGPANPLRAVLRFSVPIHLIQMGHTQGLITSQQPYKSRQYWELIIDSVLIGLAFKSI